MCTSGFGGFLAFIGGMPETETAKTHEVFRRRVIIGILPLPPAMLYSPTENLDQLGRRSVNGIIRLG